MMRSFFQNLELHRVRYLLISGQASVLYGAATFSEDFDLWIEPTAPNLHAFILSLREMNGLVYKLTPPLSVRNLRRGHGFHFRLPVERLQTEYLDVMGKPPRVGRFATVFRDASWFGTAWGKIPTIGIVDLVEVKKTRRLSDYDIISNLVRFGCSPANLP